MASASKYQLEKLVESIKMSRKILLIAVAAFAVAQAAPGSRFTPTRDALDDAFQNAEKYYEEQRAIFNELYTKTTKSVSAYLEKALKYSAKHADMLHTRIDQAVVTESDDVAQCRSEENKIEAIYTEYLNEVFKGLKNYTTGQVWMFEHYLTLTQNITQQRRESAKRCDNLGSEAATSKCRNDILNEFREEFKSLKEPMESLQILSEFHIYHLNTYYPLPGIVRVSVTKYNELAHGIVLPILKCISELQ